MMDIVTPFNESPTGAFLLHSDSHHRFRPDDWEAPSLRRRIRAN